MTPELILHLGDFRTGSTAIQHWLRRDVAAHGLYYPPGHNHVVLAQCLPDPVERAHHYKALAADLAKCKAPRAVISAEHFEMADPALLADALQRHLPRYIDRIRLIAYVRPHPEAYLARFAESTKIGSFNGSLSDYLDWPQTMRRMSYARRLGRWRAIFGNMLTVRLYASETFPGGDVVRDFALWANGQDPGPTPRRANPSPGIEALALARGLHTAIGPLRPGSEGARWTLGRHLGRLIEAQGPSLGGNTPLRLHRDLADRLVAAFRADAEATDTTHFNGTPFSDALVAARAAALPEAQSLDPEDHFGAETRAVLSLWGGMMRDGLLAPDGPEILDGLYHE